MKITAYAWASGVIKFGNDVPEYATLILSGDKERVVSVIKTLTITHPDSEKLIIPDVFCASSRYAAYDALSHFIEQAHKAYELQPKTVRWKKWQVSR